MDRPTCNQCNENVVNDGIQCDGQCSKYYHYQCVKISKTKYKKMIFETGSWRCYNCSFGNANNLIEREIKDSLQYIIHKLQVLEQIKNILNNHEERLRAIEENNRKERNEDVIGDRKNAAFPSHINENGGVVEIPKGIENEEICYHEQQGTTIITETIISKNTETQSDNTPNLVILEKESSSQIVNHENLDLQIIENRKSVNGISTKENNSYVENFISIKNTEQQEIINNETYSEISSNNIQILNSTEFQSSISDLLRENDTDIENNITVWSSEMSLMQNDVISMSHKIVNTDITSELISKSDITTSELKSDVKTSIEIENPTDINPSKNLENSDIITSNTRELQNSEIQLEKSIKDISFIENQTTNNNTEESENQKMENNLNVIQHSEASNIPHTECLNLEETLPDKIIKTLHCSSKINHSTETDKIGTKNKGNQTNKIKTSNKNIQTGITFNCNNTIIIQPSFEQSIDNIDMYINNELCKFELPTNDELKQYIPPTWKKQNRFHKIKNNYQLRLSGTEPEYELVKKYFTGALPYCKIDRIYRIENVHTYLMILLKIDELRKLYNIDNIVLLSLFHGTKNCNMDLIMKYNFNWRLCKYAGVSFSANAAYSLNYTENSDTDHNFMFLSRVLAVEFCEGYFNLPILPKLADIVISPDRSTFVKFDDHCFYPEYLIRFKKNV